MALAVQEVFAHRRQRRVKRQLQDLALELQQLNLKIEQLAADLDRVEYIGTLRGYVNRQSSSPDPHC
jgi:hypothetical protein